MRFFGKKGFLSLTISILSMVFVSNIFAAIPTTAPVSDKIKEDLNHQVENIEISSGVQDFVHPDASGDKFTQSEAHLQLDDVKQNMADFLQQAVGAIPDPDEEPQEPKTPNQMVTPYLNIVAQTLRREVEFKNTHYALYHGYNTPWRVLQDFYKQLYAYFNPDKKIPEDFVFLRFTKMSNLNLKEYLSQHVQEFGGINDNILEVRSLMISASLALFSGVGTPGECTWNYFVMKKGHYVPDPEMNMKPLLETFNLSYSYKQLAKDLEPLIKMLSDASPEQTFLQIFIPQNKIDDVAYLAWILGFPAHPKSMELVETMIANKPKVGNVTGSAVKKLMKKYKHEGVDNPDYQELLQDIDTGKFGIDAFMKVYRNNPSELDNPNDVQARLFITDDVMLNPASGVKMFSYNTTPREVQAEYLKKLNKIVQKIIKHYEKNDKKIEPAV